MTEALICDYIRTPIGRVRGSLASVRTDDLGAIPIAALIMRNPDIDPAEVDEVIFGCANQAGEDNRNVARMSLLLAGLPISVPGVTVNRLCGSGMDAVATAARLIKSGDANLVIAGGVESMTRAPFAVPKIPESDSDEPRRYDTSIGWRFINPKFHARFGTDAMPETAEIVAERYQVSRIDQDAFALRSQLKAAEATQNGRLADEITPVEATDHSGEGTTVLKDEHPRDTSMEKLAALDTPFRPNGTITAGNASGINDGAAALLLASPSAARDFRLTAWARVTGSATAGVAPNVMGVGPIPATQKLCSRLRLLPTEFDVVEVNEAFASQSLAVLRGLDFKDDDDRVNPNGGAIALGHPLGMSGARITGTAALELKLRGSGRALATMCVGVGQGITVAMEAA